MLYTFFVNMLFAFIFINLKSYQLSNLSGIVLLAEQAHGLGGFFVGHAGLGMCFGSAFVEDSIQFGIVDELAVALLDRFQRRNNSVGHIFFEGAIAFSGVRFR